MLATTTLLRRRVTQRRAEGARDSLGVFVLVAKLPSNSVQVDSETTGSDRSVGHWPASTSMDCADPGGLRCEHRAIPITGQGDCRLAASFFGDRCREPAAGAVPGA